MGRDRTATLAALAQLGRVKTVGGFARAQPHLGHLAFWNTHSGWLFKFKLVQRTPGIRGRGRRLLSGLGFGP